MPHNIPRKFIISLSFATLLLPSALVHAANYNGDGYDDLMLGKPDHNHPQNGPDWWDDMFDVGGAMIALGSNLGLSDYGSSYQWGPDLPGLNVPRAESLRFGEALGAGDFDGDGYDDAVIGIPGWGSLAASGKVVAIYGSANSLNYSDNQHIWPDASGVAGVSEAGAEFGTTVATGDFNNDGYDDLVVGSPLKNIGGLADAGCINVLYGSAGGISTSGDIELSQDSAGILGTSEAGDRFGGSLAVADFNADGYDDLAVGSPGEADNGGVVQIILGGAGGLTTTGDQMWHMDQAELLGTREPGDEFGFALAAGHFDHDNYADLAIGVPGASNDAGVILVLRGSAGALTSSNQRLLLQGDGLGGSFEPGDRFGSALAAYDFDDDGYDDLAVGVPGENDDVGGAHVIHGGFYYLGYSDYFVAHQPEYQTWHERYGSALAVGDYDGDGRGDLVIGGDGYYTGQFPGATCGATVLYSTVLYGSWLPFSEQDSAREDYPCMPEGGGYASGLGRVLH